MSGIDPNGGGALVVPGGGGTSLPTASAAGELPVSDGAGSAYTATTAGDVLALGMVAALTGEPAGAALISDGAGDIATTSADVSALLAAANAAAARTAIGFGPTTQAAQAQAVTYSRRGPVAMTAWSDTAYVAPLATPASGAQPSITKGSSGVIVVYSTQAGGYGATHLLASHDLSAPGSNARGYALTIDGSGIVLLSITAGFPGPTFPGVLAAIGWAAVAWSIDAPGTTVRYSIGAGSSAGSAAATAAGSLADLLPRTTDAVRIGRGIYSAVAATVPVAYIGLWSSILSDADLAALASSPAAGAPTLPSVPAWEWSAASLLGCERVSVGADVYARSGTPALWMP